MEVDTSSRCSHEGQRSSSRDSPSPECLDSNSVQSVASGRRHSGRQHSPEVAAVRDNAQFFGIPTMVHYDPVPIMPPLGDSIICVDDYGITDSAHDMSVEIEDIIVCPSCSSEIDDDIHDSFQCDLCSNWLHIACLNISKEVYDAINVMNQTNELSGVAGDCLKINCNECQCSPPMPRPGLSGLAPSSTGVFGIADTGETISETPGMLAAVVPTPVLHGTVTEEQTFTVVQGARCSLSNFFLSPLSFKGVDFRSAEHAYQFECAQRQGFDQLAGDIKNAPTASKAKRLARSKNKSCSRNYRISLMWDVLVQKAAQSDVFLQDLIASEGSFLVHSTGRRDILWGTGLEPNSIVRNITDFDGENVFGRLLMDLRSVVLGVKNEFCLSDYDVNDAAVRVPISTASSSIFCATGLQGRSSTSPNVSRARGVRRPVTHARHPNQHKCFHCGVPGHVKRVCRLKNHPVVCDSCKQAGHKKKYCTNVRPVSGYFVLPTVNLCHTNVSQRSSGCRFSSSIASANFVGNIAPSAAINTIRTFSGFQSARQSF